MTSLDASSASGTSTLDVTSCAGKFVIIRPRMIIPAVLVPNLTVGVGDVYYEREIQPKQSFAETTTPDRFLLMQNHPNPFNPSTRLEYILPTDEHVSLRIFNVLGEEVARVVEEYQSAGYKSVEFDASNLPSGIYFYRLTAGKFADIKKMVLIR